MNDVVTVEVKPSLFLKNMVAISGNLDFCGVRYSHNCVGLPCFDHGVVGRGGVEWPNNIGLHLHSYVNVCRVVKIRVTLFLCYGCTFQAENSVSLALLVPFVI